MYDKIHYKLKKKEKEKKNEAPLPIEIMMLYVSLWDSVSNEV